MPCSSVYGPGFRLGTVHPAPWGATRTEGITAVCDVPSHTSYFLGTSHGSRGISAQCASCRNAWETTSVPGAKT